MAQAGSPPRLAYAAWLAVCVIWGTTYLAIRIGLETIPPMLLGGIRFLAAGAILAAVITASRGSMPPAREWPRHALLGALLLGVGNGCVVWAERWIPSGIAAVGVAAVPFWMAGTEALIGGHRAARGAMAGLALGFSGVVLLIWPSVFAGDVTNRGFALGMLLVQVACAGWALGSSLTKRTFSSGSALAASAAQQLSAGALMVAVGTTLGEWQVLDFTARSAAAQLYLVVFGSLVAYSAYMYALQHLPIATVSLYAYANPVIAVLLGALIASEPLTPRIAVAAGFVLVGVALVRRSSRGGPDVSDRTRSQNPVPPGSAPSVRPPVDR